jgi:heme-degrading monooxygenase HmoA
MLTQIVRFRSALSDAEVMKVYASRAPRYRRTEGLLQKYYLRFDATEEHGAVYLWNSADDLRRFRESELARSIPDAYRVKGTPDIQVAEVVMVLHPRAETGAHERIEAGRSLQGD